MGLKYFIGEPPVRMKYCLSEENTKEEINHFLHYLLVNGGKIETGSSAETEWKMKISTASQVVPFRCEY